MGTYVLAHLNALGGGFVAYIIPFLFVLSLVVFFHELGHFLVARWCGVRVLVFSIGFGPEIVGFNDRHGTRWKISAIPLGAQQLLRSRFDVAHAFSAPDAQAALIWRSITGRPVAFTCVETLHRGGVKP